MICGSSIFTSWFRLVYGSQRSQVELYYGGVGLNYQFNIFQDVYAKGK